MKFKKWHIALLVVFLLPILYWVKWTRGQEVIRSRSAFYTVVIRKFPQQQYWFNPIAYLADSGEVRGTLVYEFTVYSDYQSAPLTSYTTIDEAFNPWKTANIKWLSSASQSGRFVGHFVVSFNNAKTIECQFANSVFWRRL